MCQRQGPKRRQRRRNREYLNELKEFDRVSAAVMEANKLDAIALTVPMVTSSEHHLLVGRSLRSSSSLERLGSCDGGGPCAY